MAAALALFLSRATLGADNIFDVGKRPAERALVSPDPLLPGLSGPDSEMTRRLVGVLADLPAARIKELRACVLPGNKPIDNLSTAHRDCVIHLFAKDAVRTIEIIRTTDGVLAARDISDQPPDQRPAALVARLSPERFYRLASGWSSFRAPFDVVPPDTAPTSVAALTPPYAPGWFTFDKEALGRRFLAGRSTTIPGVARDLSTASIYIRLPKGYDPRYPAGLLVWVSPMDSGRPLPSFFPVADELGLVIVGPSGAGNECPVADRYQLVFDALATASERFHIDPRRVYVTGISGGGKIASVLWACFPDVFTGSVPIVGLACYENIPIGNGKVWPGLYAKPEARLFDLLKTSRSAAMTGPKDFNYEPILGAAKILTRDSLNVRVFEYPDMGHEAPTAARFSEALRWVDEPYRQKRDAEVAKAQTIYDRAIADGIVTADPARRRAALVEITTAGPWTPAAWKAVELLGDSTPTIATPPRQVAPDTPTPSRRD